MAAERRRVAVIAALNVVLALQFFSVVTLIVWLLFIAIVWRPRVGLLVAFGLAALFEDGGPDGLMLPGYFLYAGIGKHLGLGGILASPMEVILGLSVLVW